MNRSVKKAQRRFNDTQVMQSKRGRNFVFTGFYSTVALGAFVVGSAFGDIHKSSQHKVVIAWAAAGVFLVFGVLAVRRWSTIVGHFVALRTVPSAGAAIRLVASIVGYIILLFMIFGIIDVSITHLLVGGALTGVVLGIAAQQSLGNIFAGIVLLLARPFAVGDHIRVRAGALGGEFDGIVLSLSLTYVTIFYNGGPLKIPNSAMLNSAVGPFVAPPPVSHPSPVTDAPTETDSEEEVPFESSDS